MWNARPWALTVNRSWNIVCEKSTLLDFGAMRDSAILLLIANQGVLGIMHTISP